MSTPTPIEHKVTRLNELRNTERDLENGVSKIQNSFGPAVEIELKVPVNRLFWKEERTVREPMEQTLVREFRTFLRDRLAKVRTEIRTIEDQLRAIEVPA